MGLFDQFPYTNFHELNLDWVLQKIKELGSVYDNIDDRITKIVTEYLDKFIEGGDLEKIVTEVLEEITERVGSFPISPEMFGAVGDGVTNDTVAFQNTCKYANDHFATIKCSYGKNYLITPSAIELTQSIDFSQSTLTPTGTGTMFILRPVGGYTDLDVPDTAFLANSVSDNRLFGKIFTYVSGWALGTRINTTTDLPYVQTMECMQDGSYRSGACFGGGVENVTSKAVNVHAPQKRAMFENVHVDLTTAEKCTLVEVRRSNVHVKNVTLDMKKQVEYGGSFIFLGSGCVDCEISEINVPNFAVESSFGYIIGVYSCDNLYIHDCALKGNGWGALGFSYSGNTVIERIQSNRTDCHYYLAGDYVVRDCQLGFANFCGGHGDFVFENITFYKYGGADTITIDTRADLSLPLDGNIIIRNCNFYTPTRSKVRLWIRKDWEAGYSKTKPLATKCHLLIENCKDFSDERFCVYASVQNTSASIYDITIDDVHVKTGILQPTHVTGITGNPFGKVTVKNCHLDNLYCGDIPCDLLNIEQLYMADNPIALKTADGVIANHVTVHNSVIAGMTYNFVAGDFCITGNTIVGTRTFVNNKAPGYCGANFSKTESAKWNLGNYNI